MSVYYAYLVIFVDFVKVVKDISLHIKNSYSNN